ncbi:MAG: prepilin-type N-terminal cleavage/methylation domain-containing protein [Pirellulales bacterium]
MTRVVNRLRWGYRRSTELKYRSRSGLTLLEIIVALALSAVVITLLSAAIFGYLSQLERRRDQVAGAQLARAVLDMLRRDLQHAFVPPPQQTFPPISTGSSGMGSSGGGSSGATSTGSGATGTGTGSNTGSNTGGSTTTGSGTTGSGTTGSGTSASGSSSTGTSGTSGTSSSTGSSSSATGTVSGGTSTTGTETAAAVSVPPASLIGTQYELQWDALSSPSWQQLAGDPELAMGGGGVGTLQTISYYVIPSSGGTTTGSADAAAAPDGGLVRRAVDRVAGLSTSGLDDAASAGGTEQILAAEVQALEFAYFDGIGWTTSWDSQSMGGLPLAVSVTMTVIPPPPASRRWVTTDQEAEPIQFQMVVHLPMADAAVLQAAATAAAAGTDATGATTGGTGTTGTTGSASGGTASGGVQ